MTSVTPSTRTRSLCFVWLLASLVSVSPARGQEPGSALAEQTSAGLRRIRAELARIDAERAKAGADSGVSAGLAAVSSRSLPVLAARRVVLALHLDEAIRLALNNDLGTIVATEQARARTFAVPQARARFDPSLETSVFRTRGRRTRVFQNPLTGLPNDAVTNQNDRLDLSIGLSQLLSTGMRVELTLSQSRSETVGASNNPQVDVSARASVTQPLLKGRGFDVTLAELRNARLDRADSFARLAQTFEQLVLDVRSAYWAVVSAETSLSVQQQNLSSALEFLDGERKKASYGSGRELDVAVAEAAAARRREAVIRAETQLEDARDALLNRIAPSADLLAWDVFLVPLDRPVYVPPPSLDPGRAVRVAFARRLDLRIAARDLERDERNLMVAENGVLPTLDLSVSGGVAAVDEKHHNAFSRLDPPEDAFDLRAGLTLRLPLLMRSELASRDRARFDLRAAERELERLRSQAILELRRALRAIASSQERVVVNEQSLRLAQRQLDTEKEAVKIGGSIPRNILDAQQQLANARLSLQSALIEYREAIASFDGRRGVLLDRYRSDLPDLVIEAIDEALSR